MSESFETWDFADLTAEDKLKVWRREYEELKLDCEDAENGYAILRQGLVEIKEALNKGPYSKIHDVLEELGI